jgi:hypothetical protein
MTKTILAYHIDEIHKGDTIMKYDKKHTVTEVNEYGLSTDWEWFIGATAFRDTYSKTPLEVKREENE